MPRMLPISGFDGYYVTDDGRVWSDLLYRGTRGRWLKPRKAGRGYLAVQLFRAGVGSARYIHVLVTEAFHGARPEGLEVRHLNGDMVDNRAGNLTWGTHAENMQDKIRHGTATGWGSRKTHCPSGHPYLGENLYVNPQGGRECKACGRVRSLAYYHRSKGRPGVIVKRLGDADRPTVK